MGSYYFYLLKFKNGKLPSRQLMYIKYNLENIDYNPDTVCKLCNLSGKPDNILKMLQEEIYHESCLLEKYARCPGGKVNLEL